ncbi:MAG TPA: AMP-binding protein [Armatimonadota bacterium]|nr:AMP-binding protein [Armatimonadota bacterium]
MSEGESSGASVWHQGRLLLGVSPGEPFNACERVVDRNCARDPEATAAIHRNHHGDRRVFTFEDLRRAVSRFASALDALGVNPGDRVFTLLEPMPELFWSILGAIRTGAIAGPLFAAFGSEAIRDRLGDSGARVLITHGRHLLKVRAAIEGLPGLKQVLVVDPPADGLRGIERDLAALLADASDERPPHPTSEQDPMLLHYSSGTTGKPKGVLHVHEALVGHAATARAVLDLRREDSYWCTADPGWVTGTSYALFGPWALGVPQIHYEGGFSSSAWYSLIEAERVSVWYTSPTALRMLMRDGVEAARAHDLSSLRHICSVGEPLNPEVIRWGLETYGHTIRDTWWQTETGCMQIANAPWLPVRPGSMGKPLPGVTAAVLDPTTHEPLPPGQEGLLALVPPWPSMFRTYWNRLDLYGARFRNGFYLTGDRAYTDADGYYWFVGRDDDVINTSGHLVGPFEIESALLTHPAVVEAAAFPIPVADAGEAVAARVVLAAGSESSRELIRDLKTLVRRQVGPYAVPREVVVVDRLPRTRSGKIMRRVARAEHLGLPVGDLSSLDES